MKYTRILALGLCMSLLLVGGGLSSCRNQGKDPVEEPTTTPNETDTEKGTEQDPGKDPEKDPEWVEPVIEGPYADSIMYANRQAGAVQAFYADAQRENYRIINGNMTLDYVLTAAKEPQVGAISNTKGNPYLQNTMDVFIRMDNGSVYYASESTSSARANIYRLGYYYYDIHLLEQDFLGDAAITATHALTYKKSNVRSNDVDGLSVTTDGVISYVAGGMDPYVYLLAEKKNSRLSFDAEEYNALQFSVKCTNSTEGQLYFVAGSKTSHNAEQQVKFNMTGNGEWQTYTVVLSGVTDYSGKVTGFRFDIGTSGEKVEIKDIKGVKISSDAPAVLLDRTFHTYSDKVNQVLHFVATQPVDGIASLGMVTEIKADTVNGVIVKDAKGTHDSIDGVDWSSCEYVGFDIKDAGVFGYILLAHETSGKLEVALSDGVYTVTQTSCPKDGKLVPNAQTTENDFYMGHRLYTDENHTFDAFVAAAEAERHPLEVVGGETYLGYDALRGAYKFGIGGSGFNEPFFTEQNRHYSCDVSFKGDGTDRNIYVYTYFTGGCGENALILDENEMLLPIPTMICKNFKGENEEPIFDAGDASYSETYFPLSVKANGECKVTVLNLYMNWGQVPLKQLSSIQYFWPYYHLSLGTTETSCISPWYGARDLWTLPDFRSMSMPYWFELPKDAGYNNQPQHTHGGFQYFLQYTDALGNYVATENVRNDIDSSGPVYTDVKMDYVSDDGRIKVSYNHIELPETDELRAYYEINYEILEDIQIADFAKDFSFYSFEGYAGTYKKIGYLNEQNQAVHGNVNATATPEVIKLGDQCPYVALYDLNTTAPSFINNNVNLGFVIYDSQFTIGGQSSDAGFVVVGQNSKYSLSLDLGNVTLKAGDTFKLCMIISPWGFYTSTDDGNMQKIRENTCLDRLKVTVADGELMDSVYVPKIRTTNGKSAEFTVSGASNNKVVRVYGFDKLTAPVIYEKIGGEWVRYDVSSQNTPDIKGYAHAYDGYAVYYDRDGTYSYAFAFDMDGKQSRTFKIVAENDFAGWDQIDVPVNKVALDVLVTPSELQQLVAAGRGFGKTQVAEDESYVRFYGSGDGQGEAFFDVYKASSDTAVGQYLVVKYRIPKTNADKFDFEFFSSTRSAGAQGGESFFAKSLVCDGEWHVLIADMSAQGLPTFKADGDGNYAPKYLRFDVFNNAVGADSYVDIAYVGIADSLVDICRQNGSSGRGEMYEGGSAVNALDFSTGKTVETGGSKDTVYGYVDFASGWTVSDVRYMGRIDFINGMGDGDGAYNSRGTGSDTPLDKIEYKGKTVDGGMLVIAGWAVAKGGVDKYMWSADDGKTWQECSLYNTAAFGNLTAGQGIAAAANNFFASTGYDVMSNPDKVAFQGAEGRASGVAADLSAYAGKTVDVVFALVPIEDPDGLCIITVIEQVQVEG